MKKLVEEGKQNILEYQRRCRLIVVGYSNRLSKVDSRWLYSSRAVFDIDLSIKAKQVWINLWFGDARAKVVI